MASEMERIERARTDGEYIAAIAQDAEVIDLTNLSPDDPDHPCQQEQCPGCKCNLWNGEKP